MLDNINLITPIHFKRHTDSTILTEFHRFYHCYVYIQPLFPLNSILIRNDHCIASSFPSLLTPEHPLKKRIFHMKSEARTNKYRHLLLCSHFPPVYACPNSRISSYLCANDMQNQPFVVYCILNRISKL